MGLLVFDIFSKDMQALKQHWGAPEVKCVVCI